MLTFGSSGSAAPAGWQRPSGARALARFLLGDDQPPPPLELLEESGLAAYAAPRLSGSPGGGALQLQLLTETARHLAIRREVAELLRAWREAGIQALLFKGFHLAEFVYPVAGQRRYSDVDLLLPPGTALTAARIAAQLGWSELWHAERPGTPFSNRPENYAGHEVVQFLHPGLGIHLDAHRRLVHNSHNHVPWFAREERITRLVWEASSEVEWEGVSVRLPRAADAVLVGLVLNRLWSGDGGRLRPHDYLDFSLLVDGSGLTRAQLEARARELGCARTLALFLTRCDPYRRHLDLGPRGRRIRREHLGLLLEAGDRLLVRTLMDSAVAVGAPLETLAALPGALRAVRALRASRDPQEAAARLAHPVTAPRPLSPAAWLRAKRGVHRALRLLGYLGEERRLLSALALYSSLRRRSCPVLLRFPEDEGAPRLELRGRPLYVGADRLE